MRNLIYLIIRYGAFLTFLFLELFCFYLIVSFNESQRDIWNYSSNRVTGSIKENLQGIEDFFTLKEKNDSLLLENAYLLETVINYRVYSEKNNFQNFEFSQDSTQAKFELIPAIVCDKTINLRNNYMTLSAGRKAGIKEGMGVIIPQGVVGLVKSTSDNFSTVLLINHGQSRISALIKNKNYHGNLIWESSDTRKMKLLDVPKHANVSIGDTIETSGYSISFPKALSLGKISSFDISKGSNYYEINVDLDYDLSTITSVFVVAYRDAKEKETLIQQQDE